MNNEGMGSMVMLAAFLVVIIGLLITKECAYEGQIKSSKNFILEKATYKCTKTNELKEQK